ALCAKQAGIDGSAGAAERNECHGQMRLLDGEHASRAHLIAVERTMARPALPARALARPFIGAAVLAGVENTGLVAFEVLSSRPVIFAERAAEEAAEAEPFIG